jgi:nitrite reductase/ring-hydroxylating ferredoxin subunit
MMDGLIRICKTSDLEEGKPIEVECDALDTLAVYQYQGSYFVTDNFCSHGGAYLSQGELKKDEIHCLLHGGAFSIKTGEATKSPCRIPIAIYPVTLIDGDIYISLPSE